MDFKQLLENKVLLASIVGGIVLLLVVFLVCGSVASSKSGSEQVEISNEPLKEDVELLTSIADYEDVTITYTVSEEASAYLKVEGNKLVVTRPDNATGDKAIKKALTATITCTSSPSFLVKYE